MKPADFLKSSTFRFVLSYMALFAGSVLLLLGFIYWSTISFLSQQADLSIRNEIIWLSGIYKEHGLDGLVLTVNERSRRHLNEDEYYSVISADARLLAGNLPPDADRSTAKKGWINIQFRSPYVADRIIHVRAKSVKLAGGELLEVGRNTRLLVVSHQLIVPALLWSLMIMIILAVLGGAVMSRSVLRRIEQINLAVREIMAGDLTRRIPSRGSSDDFDQLASNLNDMLDEIEHLMEGIRHVSNSVAHDLRTPLTRLRNQLEELRGKVGDNRPCVEHVDNSIQCADQLLATFSALLRIARIEAGGQKPAMKVVELSMLLDDAKELYEAVAENKQITITTNTSTPDAVLADRDLLFQAIANLLDNAIKYTQQGGEIRLTATQYGQYVEVRVADNGPGIPAAEREKVLQRFYRLEKSRSGKGSGLGLSLVAAVVKMHNGTLLLSDNNPGLKVTMVFNAFRNV